jgi:hypothetical protein
LNILSAAFFSMVVLYCTLRYVASILQNAVTALKTVESIIKLTLAILEQIRAIVKALFTIFDLLSH